MKTFSEFLNEIAVNPDLAPPRTTGSFRPATGTTPSDDSHAVIPLVMHPKTLAYLKELGDMGAPPQAARLLRRFADQPSDGAPVAVNASNLEVSTLRDFATRMMSGSDSIFGREFGGEVKDDAIRGMSLANELLRMLERGESAASGKSTHNFSEIDFKRWLENYMDIDQEKEDKRVQDINMTASLPWSDKPPMDNIRELTRGFHLNTIIGRMMQPWVGGLKFAPVDYKMADVDFQKAYRWRVSKTDIRGNNAYKAAYELFKQEIANAVSALPFKTGKNVISGKPEDVLAKSKEFFSNYNAEDKDLIESLEAAWKIFVGVFGLNGSETQKRNFMNFIQIVLEEFMTIGEMLPTMGDDDGTRQVTNELVKRLNVLMKEFEAVKTK